MALTKISHDDNDKAVFGTSEDLQIYHNGTNSSSYIDNNENHLYIRNNVDGDDGGDIFIQAKSGEESINCYDDGQVELYYDSVKKFETVSAGIKVSGTYYTDDGNEIRLGTGGDLQVFHSGSYSMIKQANAGTGDLYIDAEGSKSVLIRSGNGSSGAEAAIVCNANAATELYHSGTKTLETQSNGIIVQAPEGGAAVLYIYADEGDDAADKWALKAEAGSSQFSLRNIASGSWEDNIVANGNGNVELYYDGSKKLETTSYGVLVAEPSGNADAVLKLEAEAGADAYLALDTSNGGGATADVRFQMDGTTKGSIEYANAGTNANCMLFRTNDNSERLRIDSSGDLHFRNAGTGHQGLKWYKDSNLGVSFSYGEGNANPTLNIYRQDAQSGFPYGSLIINTGHGTTPTQALKLRTDKNIELAGSLIMANGQGIDFSATSDATGKTSETLDDYEEGLWTPTIGGTSGSGTVSYSVQKGWYTKVGKLVNLWYYVNWTTSGTIGGTLQLGSFPFTVISGSNWDIQLTGSVMVNQLDIDGNANNLVVHTWYGVNYGQFFISKDLNGWSGTGYNNSGAAIGHLAYMS